MKKTVFLSAMLLIIGLEAYSQSLGANVGYSMQDGTQGMRTDINFCTPMAKHLDFVAEFSSVNAEGKTMEYRSYDLGGVPGVPITFTKTFMSNNLEVGVAGKLGLGNTLSIRLYGLVGIGVATSTSYYSDENAVGTRVYGLFCADLKAECLWQFRDRISTGLYIDGGTLSEARFANTRMTFGAGLTLRAEF